MLLLNFPSHGMLKSDCKGTIFFYFGKIGIKIPIVNLFVLCVF